VKANGNGSDLFARLSALARAEEPPDPITWIEQHRCLCRESSREVGPFSFDRAPYMREVQSAILSPRGGEVVVMWASQCGKSELLLNSLLYWSEIDPAPGLVVVPDWRAAQSFAVDRIRPMLRDAAATPAHLGELQDERGVDSVFHMTLGVHMPVTISHASGSVALSMRPIRYLVFDEVSRFPATAKGPRSNEGDPIQLAKIRTSTFGGSARIVYVSSPVEAGACRISQFYQESTREKWHCRCPHCGELQILRIAEMDFESATCRCLACGESSTQDAWQGTAGEWVAETEHPRRGFWTNIFSSPFVRWPVVFEEYRNAVHLKRQGDYASLRVVQNTRLAETYTTRVEAMSDPVVLMAAGRIMDARCLMGCGSLWPVSIRRPPGWSGSFAESRLKASSFCLIGVRSMAGSKAMPSVSMASLTPRF
jgi:phage terminase large subunit GpA-like protein